MPVNFDSIIRSIERQQQRANAANQRRYRQLLQGIGNLSKQVVGGTFGQMLSYLDKLGAAARTRIEQQAARAQGSATQELISKGLGNTTITETARRGIEAEKEQALQTEEERRAQQRAGALAQRAGAQLQIGQMRASAIEGRQDVGPDLGMFANLIKAAAASERAGPKRRTLTIPGSTGPGALTRWRAEQATSRATGGGGGISQQEGGGVTTGAALRTGGGAVMTGAQLRGVTGAGAPVYAPGGATGYPDDRPTGLERPTGSQQALSGPAAKIGWGGHGQPSTSEQNIMSMARQMAESEEDMGDTQPGMPSVPETEEPKRTLTPDQRAKYKRWMQMGWGWMIPDWAKPLVS